MCFAMYFHLYFCLTIYLALFLSVYITYIKLLLYITELQAADLRLYSVYMQWAELCAPPFISFVKALLPHVTVFGHRDLGR